MNNTFEKLSSIDVTKYVEKKQGQNYLSWANAWKMACLTCPSTSRTIYENADGRNYFTDGRTAWVKVGVTIDGVEHIDQLPVMDLRNKSVPVDVITSFDVNKAIQRSTVKALALHGLGINIYAGEDFEEADTSKDDGKHTHITLNIGDENWDKAIKYVQANRKLGAKKLIEQLSKKYTIDDVVSLEIQKEITQ